LQFNQLMRNFKRNTRCCDVFAVTAVDGRLIRVLRAELGKHELAVKPYEVIGVFHIAHELW